MFLTSRSVGNELFSSTKDDSHSPVLTSTQTRVLNRLKRAIRRGETPVRWIDFFAAETAMQTLQSSLAMQCGSDAQSASSTECDTQCELTFDLVLVLSYLSSLGVQDLSTQDLGLYKHLFAFHWQSDQSTLEQSLAQCPPQVILSDAAAVSSLAVTASADQGLALSPVVFIDDKYALRRIARLNQGVKHWLTQQAQHGRLSASYSSRLLAHLNRSMACLFDFSSLATGDVDYQAQAVAQSVLANALLVSGGPGTGKTTTAAKIILIRLIRALFEEQIRTNSEATDQASAPAVFSTVCLAPTGKAAQRLASSLRAQAVSLVQKLDLSAEEKNCLANALPDQGKTIHRYLIEQGVPIEDFSSDAYIPDNARVFSGGNPPQQAPVVVIVDESSMVDLALMDRFLTTLSPESCVVFLGDHNQLPAVELGEVFARWVADFENAGLSALQLELLQSCLSFDCSLLENTIIGGAGQAADTSPEHEKAFNPLVSLRKSYRFSGPLADFAAVLRDGQPNEMLQWLEGNTDETVRCTWLRDKGAEAYNELQPDLHCQYQSYVEAIVAKASLAELQATFDQFQILCSTRSGPIGTEQLNHSLNVKITASLPTGSVSPSGFYHGLPIILERNLGHLDLFNGDVGFFIDKAASDASLLGAESRFSVVFYRGPDDEPIVVAPSQLPQYELAYAMTVHKSQGSEYDKVSIVVAPYAQELVSRALLYTGLTRAKKCAHLFMGRSSLQSLAV